MAIDTDTDYTPQERAALAIYEILEGRELTTAEIAERTGIQWHGAHKMMNNVSRVVPITQRNGVWIRVR